MRYLSTREIFLENLKLNIKDIEQINEVVTNEITFGGSLLGRFINSVIRKAKIGYNYLRVDSIVKAIEGELNNIIFDGLGDEEKAKVIKILAEYHLAEIKKVCYDKKLEESKKVKQLLGEKEDAGLVGSSIKWINALNDSDEISGINKSELLEKLKNFSNEIRKIKDNFSKRKELIELTYDFLETTIDVIEGFTKIVGTTSSVSGGTGSALTINPTSLNFGNKTTTHTLNININATNLENEIIKFETQDPFIISFGKSYANSLNLNVNSSSYDTILKVRFDYDKAQKDVPLKGNIKVTGKNIDIDIPIEAEATTRVSPKKPTKPITVTGNPSDTSALVGKPLWWKDNNGKWFKISNLSHKPKVGPMGQDLFQFTIPGNSNPIFSKELYESIDDYSFDKLYENYVLNSFLFEEAQMVTSQEIKRANIENKKIVKLFNKKNIISYLRTNKKDNNISDILKFAKKIKNPNAKMPVLKDSGGLVVSQIQEIINNMDALAAKLNSYDDYFWDESGIIANETLKKWLKSYNEIKSSDYAKSANTCKNIYDDNFDATFDPTATTEEKKNELEEQIENSKTVINIVDEAGRNRLLKIVELFGKAYSCFATDLIPSGRPGGRISTKTRNEYFYIGSGTPKDGTEDSGPGFGPWANKLVFRKFGEDITKLISYEKYQKILGNATIETKDGKKEGNVLLTFMRDMIDQNNLKNFDEKRSDFLTKYFGLKAKLKTSERTGSDTPENEDNEDGLKWVAESFKTDTLKEGMFIAICCKLAVSATQVRNSSTKIVGYVAKIEANKVLIKFQVGSYAPVRAYSDYDSLPSKQNLGLEGKSKKNTYVGAFKMPLENGKKINLTAAKISNINDIKTFTIEIESGSFGGSTSRQFPPGILYAKDEPVINQNLKSKSTKITDDQELNINFSFDKLTADANFGKDAIVGSNKPIPAGFI